jgi:drug/metabolite transporter (DMT)-like permease
LSGSDPNTTDNGFLERVRRAVAHAEEAARCYLAIMMAECRRLGHGLVDQMVWMLAVVGFGLVGVAVLALGLATFLDSHIGVPGSGQMIVGGAMVAVFLVGIYIRKSRGQP